MPDKNFTPNARYDIGPNAAGCGRAATPAIAQAAAQTGLGADGTLGNTELRVGLHAAGVHRKNTGPNVAGAPRSINGS